MAINVVGKQYGIHSLSRTSRAFLAKDDGESGFPMKETPSASSWKEWGENIGRMS
jgi:hypothetical protein